jgi:FkbM family methyltransferase
MRKLFYLNKVFSLFGLKLIKESPRSNSELRKTLFFNQNNFDCVIDIGANIGGFRDEVRSMGYNGLIFSFEPISELFNLLEIRKKSDEKWRVYKYAVGDKNDEIEINISSNLHSSSVLEILEEHTNAEPSSKYIQREKVEQIALDGFKSNFSKYSKIFLKIDTQGYEWNVLQGAKEFLKDVAVVQLEMSFVSLYKDQKLFNDIFTFLYHFGFEIYDVEPGFTNEVTGQQYQVDCVFVNRNHLRS